MREEDIKKIVEPVITELGLELVELHLTGSGGRTHLRIYVDVDDGVSLQQCTRASRAISDLLDRKDPIQNRYTLEVSSPGIDRPLKTERDFERHLGKMVKIKYNSGENSARLKGRISSVHSSVVEIEQDQELVRVPLDTIELAKLMIEF